MTDQSKITLDKFKQYIHSKKDLYESALRNGFYLPTYTSSIITEEFILKVVNGELWCPLYKDIRLLPCVKPPPKVVLIEKVSNLLSKLHRNGGIEDNRQPNKQWLVNILSTYNPKDEIFDKNYMPPSKIEISKSVKSIELPMSFLKGLPIKKQKSKRTRLSIIKLSKMENERQKLELNKSKIEKKLIKL